MNARSDDFRADPWLWHVFEQVCDTGGRRAGSASEQNAVALLADLGASATGVGARHQPVPYTGWRAHEWCLEDANGRRLCCHPLIHCGPTPAAGLQAEVVDVRRGEQPLRRS